MSIQRKPTRLAKFTLISGSVLFGLGIFSILDLAYSKLVKKNPFAPPDLKNNGIPLYKVGKTGWYELNSNFSGQDRYGKLIFGVNTDSHGFRSEFSGSDSTKSSARPSIVLFGDSFTYGVGIEWQDTFGAQLSLLLNTPVINAGVNSHSPTAYTYRLKKLLTAKAIPPKSIIIMAIDISDVQDEATRWRDGDPTPIDITHLPTRQSTSGSIQASPFYSPQNFQLTHHIYYFLEGIVKHYTDNFLLHYHSRSAFTHRPWHSLKGRYSPLGVSGGLKRIEQKINTAALLSKEQNHPFYLLIYPWPAQLGKPNHFRWDEAISSYCKPPACSGVINTLPRFMALKNNNKAWQDTYYIRGDMHFKASGNRVIAESIAAQLTRDHRY